MVQINRMENIIKSEKENYKIENESFLQEKI